MTTFDYAARISALKLNTYFVSEGDKDYNIRTQAIVPANPCCNCYSIAKAFTVTAIGMLYDRGLLTPCSLMTDILSDYLPENMDSKWRRLTIHDIMLHKIGFDCGKLDIDAEDASEYPSNDYLNLVLSSPLAYEPGRVHQYTDAAYYLLSRIAAQVSGMDLADLMRPVLMDVMRFKEFAWSVCPQGYSMGATGLYLRTEDLVKLGILYMNGGMWKGTRVISQEWVDKVLSNGYELKHEGNGWYAKGGMRGQMLIFNPEKGIAVACHSFESEVSHEVLIPEA